MKKLLMSIVALLATVSIYAEDTYVVTVNYNGTSASVSIPSAITSYVSCPSGSSSHVKLVQTSTATKNPGEIIYQLSGTSDDGEFYMEGEFKATIQLNDLTLTNPDSTAIHIKNGKRIKVSLANGTVNTLADGTKNADSKGCFHCKGHTEFQGKGTLNIKSNFYHAIYSKEYIEVKNCTINVTGAKKDGIHCQQYFLMRSGTISITSPEDDGIQVELKGDTSTGKTSDHEDEDSGNFYMTSGTLSITGHGGVCIKTDGVIKYDGGEQIFNTNDVIENAGTSAIISAKTDEEGTETIYDLNGRQVPEGSLRKGVYIVRRGNKVSKRLVK